MKPQKLCHLYIMREEHVCSPTHVSVTNLLQSDQSDHLIPSLLAIAAAGNFQSAHQQVVIALCDPPPLSTILVL